MTLYVTIKAVNREFIGDQDRILFGRAGGAMFGIFARYQLVLGAMACVCSMGLLILENRRTKQALFFMLALAMVGAVITLPLTIKIDEMRLRRETQTSEFKKAHGKSMIIFSSEMLLLLAAGFMMPAVVAREDKYGDTTTQSIK